MSQTVRNDSLDIFETNLDQDLGKAIAEAATALSKGTQLKKNAKDSNDTQDVKNLRSEKKSISDQ